MFGITVAEAAAICGGSVYGKIENREFEILRLTIDSRDVREGDMFIAYKGEKVDGHDFMLQALEKGAVCALAEHLPLLGDGESAIDAVWSAMSDGSALSEENCPESLRWYMSGAIIVVKDVQEAVETLAAAFRERIDIPVVGITGSVGKTTAKEMIAAVLGEHFNVHKTIGNQNNAIGLPLSICSLDKDAECGVFEMGINHFGEMRHLGRMARPDIAVYTVIGHAHLEFLGDLNGVLKAKTEMLEYMSEDALLVVNGDDPLLRDFECPQWKLTYGRGENCEVRASNVRNGENGHLLCDITYQERTVHADIPAFGEHMVYAALEGAAVGFAMGLSDREIERGISKYETVGRRFAIEDTGYLRLIDDCYNANPDSVRNSINTLSTIPGRKVCVFGDMLELGRNTEDMHREIGRYAAGKGIDLLLGCGRLGVLMSQAFRDKTGNPGTGLDFGSFEELAEALPVLLNKDDVVLVKASKGARLWRASEIIEKLTD